MANLNKVMLIGRLTRDPESRTFPSGGKVVQFGFAVNNRKKNANGGYEDVPVFVDVDVFDNGARKTGSLVEETLRKGSQVYLEGRLQFDQWNDKEGQKRSKLKIVADNFQYLDAKGKGEAVAQPATVLSSPAGDDEIPF